jgi:exopolysaccharide/PEP-CTERM locus tyrosine autokinase
MGLIEQAARRLEELRKAGADAPDLPPEIQAANAEPAAEAAPQGQAQPQPARPQVAPKTAAPPGKRVKIDLDRLAASGFVTPDAPRARIAEEFRIVKRPLLANAKTAPAGNLVMVTSAMPGDGKTFSAVNLALSIAMEFDRTVLLVDADVAHPSVPGVLGLPSPMPGLLDALAADSVNLAPVLLRTNVEKLTFLPAGRPHPRATELLASEAMNRLLDDMAARYSDRIIIFDSPPLLLTTEARALATHMGQIVFVVRAESTLQRDVTQALSTIESCPLKLILLNEARTSSQGAYGYGYYGG